MSNHDRIRELKDLLKGYCTHSPPVLNSASIQVVHEFKSAVKQGNRILGKATPLESELTSAINNLHRFWT